LVVGKPVMGNEISCGAREKMEAEFRVRLQEEEAKSKRTVEDVQRQLAEATTQLEQLRADLAAVHEAKAELERRAVADKEAAQHELEDVRTALAAKEEELGALEAKLAEATAHEKQLAAELERQTAESERQLAELKAAHTSEVQRLAEEREQESQRLMDDSRQQMVTLQEEREAAVSAAQKDSEEAQKRLRTEMEERVLKVCVETGPAGGKKPVRNRRVRVAYFAAQIQEVLAQREVELSEVHDRYAALEGETGKVREELEQRLTMAEATMVELQVEIEAKRRIERELAQKNSEIEEIRAQLTLERRKSVELERKITMQASRLVQQRFGAPLDKYEAEQLPAYPAPIPKILIFMRDYLHRHGGLESQGIFRIAAEQSAVAKARKELNDGVFEQVRDINTMANLITQWFRELPRPLLHAVDADEVLQAAKPDRAWKVLSAVPELERSICMWLLDLAIEVAHKSAQNKMTLKNMSVVLSPNLFNMPDVKPDQSLSAVESKKLMDQIKQYSVFLELLLAYREAHPPAIQA
jgi:hypothetical protein